jgi:hypothetical protein
MSSPSMGANRTDKHIAIVSTVLLILSSGSALSAEPCRLAVRLSGDQKLIKHVGDGLIEQGISLDPEDDCTATHASLSTVADGLLIRIVNVNGQTLQQVVATPGAAVSLIESWVRPELTDSLLNPSETGRGTSDKEASVEGDSSIAKKTDEASHPKMETDIWVRPALELSVGRDGSLWIGTRIMGCVSIGRVCVGIAGRFARDLGATGDAAYFSTSLMSLDALATIEILFEFRKLSLIPGFALGGGWVFMQKMVPTGVRLINEDDRKCGTNTFGIRVETFLTAAYGLKNNLYLDTSLGVDILPPQPSRVYYKKC